MKRFLYVMLLSIPIYAQAQVYLDPEPIKAYDFEEYIKNDSFYAYNPKTIH